MYGYPQKHTQTRASIPGQPNIRHPVNGQLGYMFQLLKKLVITARMNGMEEANLQHEKSSSSF
jgi:hypothetical protein